MSPLHESSARLLPLVVVFVGFKHQFSFAVCVWSFWSSAANWKWKVRSSDASGCGARGSDTLGCGARDLDALGYEVWVTSSSSLGPQLSASGILPALCLLLATNPHVCAPAPRALRSARWPAPPSAQLWDARRLRERGSPRCRLTPRGPSPVLAPQSPTGLQVFRCLQEARPPHLRSLASAQRGCESPNLPLPARELVRPEPKAGNGATHPRVCRCALGPG